LNWLPLEAHLTALKAALGFRGAGGGDEDNRSKRGPAVVVPAELAAPLLAMLLGLPDLFAKHASQGLAAWEACAPLRSVCCEVVGFLGTWLRGQGPQTLGIVFSFLYSNLTHADTPT